MSTLLEVEDLEVHFGRPDAPGTVKAGSMPRSKR